LRPGTAKTFNKTQSFKSLEGKKSQICDLLCEILFNKYAALKRRKSDVKEYISKRLQGAVVSSELKSAIEKDCVALFSNAPERKEAAKLPSKPQLQLQQPNQQQYRPEIQD